MIEFPTKKATTVATTAILAVFEKRVKLGVAVPPEMKEPTTIAMPVARFKGVAGFSGKIFINPPTFVIPQFSENTPSTAINGTAIEPNIARAFIP